MAAGDPLGAEGARTPRTPEQQALGREFYLSLAQRLKEAHRRADALPADVRIPVIRRLLTVTEGVKRDPVRASARLDAMLDEMAEQAGEPPTR